MARRWMRAGCWCCRAGWDSHCHIEQLQSGGGADEETFITGSTAALAGGTTTTISFSTQFKGAGVLAPLAEYHRRASAGAMVDYAFHQIVTDPTDAVIHTELPELVASGVRSLKVFLTYDPLRLDDRQYLAVLSAARRLGCLVTVHCENLRRNRLAVRRPAGRWPQGAEISRLVPASIVEREATHRPSPWRNWWIRPIEVFHVSCPEAAEEIARAPGPGSENLGRDLPAILRAEGHGHGSPWLRRRQVHVQPGTARRPPPWRGCGRPSGSARWRSSAPTIAAGATPAPRGKQSHGLDAPFTAIPNGIPRPGGAPADPVERGRWRPAGSRPAISSG